MGAIINFLKEILMIKENDNIKIGLTQFKEPVIKSARAKTPSIRNKDVKLSDLMRRAS